MERLLTSNSADGLKGKIAPVCGIRMTQRFKAVGCPFFCAGPYGLTGLTGLTGLRGSGKCL
jgi:hypothetical protein